MNEEQITKILLNWLARNNWEIISFDFPQSGTGIILHPNHKIKSTKTKEAIIPDIIAFKNNSAIISENKINFDYKDIDKINKLKNTEVYNNSINRLFKEISINNCYYGVTLEHNELNIEKSFSQLSIIDFLITVKYDGSIIVKHDKGNLF